MERDDNYDVTYWEQRLREADPAYEPSDDEKAIKYTRKQFKITIPENYTLLRKHLRDVKRKSKPRTQVNHMSVLIPFLAAIKKPLNQIDELDTDDYFDALNYKESTLRLHMTIVKAFLKNINPEVCKKIEPSRPKCEITKKDLLTWDEIERLLDTAGDTQHRAMIAILYDAGCRIGELMSCTVGDATPDNYGCKLWLRESKTNPRTVRLTFAALYLDRWLDEHPRRNEPDAPLFCSKFRPYNSPSRSALYNRVNKIHELSGILHRPNPHRFRHTRSTDLAKKFHGSEQQMNAVLGWSKNSRQAAHYIHLDDEDIDELMLDAAGIQKLEEVEKPKTYRCQRCHSINPTNEKECLKCGYNPDEGIVTVDDFAKMQAKMVELEEIVTAYNKMMIEKSPEMIEQRREKTRRIRESSAKERSEST